MDQTSSPVAETPLATAMRELDAAKWLMNLRKKELELAIHASNEATETYRRAVKIFNAACQQE